MFSKMMSEGARSDEANEGFGYRFDDEKLTLANRTTDTALTYEVNASNCQGLLNYMTVGFKPLCGLFSQFKYLPLKHMGKLTIELKLVNSATDCIINPNHYDETDTGIDAALRGSLQQARLYPPEVLLIPVLTGRLTMYFVPVMF